MAVSVPVCPRLWPVCLLCVAVCRACGAVCVPAVCLRVCLRVWGRVCLRVWGKRKGGPAVRAPSFCGFVWAAVSYSPTPWRVQYHRRWQS